MKTCATIVTVWLATIGLGLWLSLRASPERDLARQDLLNVIFGQARTALSWEMFQRADLYFHGGVAHLHEPHAEHHHHGSETPGTAGGAHHAFDPFHINTAKPAKAGHASGAHAAGHTGKEPRGYHIVKEKEHAGEHIPAWDWWSRLDRAVHPHGHRHLHGKRYEKEILPWLWAAVRCDPHNIEAWDVTAYWVADRLGRPYEGLKILREGIRNNPYSYQLEFTRGQLLLHILHKEKAAFKAFLAAERKWRAVAEKTPQGKQPDTLRYGHILVYLAVLSERRDHYRQALDYYRKALPYRKDPDVIRRRMKKVIEKLKAKGVAAAGMAPKTSNTAAD